MSELLSLHEATEAELLEHARTGDSRSVSELYRRHHPATEAYAAGLTDPQRAADITADAMMKVFGLLERGLGPDRAFRAYLFATVRTLTIDHARKASRETPVEDFNGFDDFTVEDISATKAEHADVTEAFKSLPPRSQQALWEHLVEGRPLEEVGAHLGLNANAAAALSFRAREALRQAYLAQHMARTHNAECERYADHLPKHVRGKLRGRTRREVEAHLDACHDCSTAAVALVSINDRLGALLLPAMLAGGLGFSVDTEGAGAATTKVTDAAVAARSRVARGTRTTAVWAVGSVVAMIGAVGVALWLTSRDAEPKSTSAPGLASDSPRSDELQTADPLPASTVTDPSASPGTVSPLGHVTSNWQHVSVPLTVDSRSTITVRVEGAKNVLMHSDPEHGRWDCQPGTGTASGVRTFTCQVPVRQLASTAVALDVEPGGSGLTVQVDVTGPEDTDPSNNRSRVQVTP